MHTFSPCSLFVWHLLFNLFCSPQCCQGRGASHLLFLSKVCTGGKNVVSLATAEQHKLFRALLETAFEQGDLPRGVVLASASLPNIFSG